MGGWCTEPGCIQVGCMEETQRADLAPQDSYGSVEGSLVLQDDWPSAAVLGDPAVFSFRGVPEPAPC